MLHENMRQKVKTLYVYTYIYKKYSCEENFIVNVKFTFIQKIFL